MRVLNSFAALKSDEGKSSLPTLSCELWTRVFRAPKSACPDSVHIGVPFGVGLWTLGFVTPPNAHRFKVVPTCSNLLEPKVPPPLNATPRISSSTNCPHTRRSCSSSISTIRRAAMRLAASTSSMAFATSNWSSRSITPIGGTSG